MDTQIGNNDTFSFSYHLWQNDQKNPTVGQFTLPSKQHITASRDGRA